MTMDDDERWERGWRKFEDKMEQMARRFGQASGLGRGAWEGLGENFRIGRMLASGDLRLVALFLIEQQPRHGYDLIKAIEDKSQGFYSPSPGVVYPALTFLEETGYVTAVAEGNKKLYTITHEGRQHLEENREAIRATLDFLGKAGERMNHWRDMAREGWPFSAEQREEFRGARGRHWGSRHRGPGPAPGPDGQRDREMPDVIPEVNESRRELKAALATATGMAEAQQRQVADILRRAADAIRQLNRRPEDDVDL